MNEPTTLNPLYPSFSGLSPVSEKIFNPLHDQKPDGKVRTCLAQSWVYSEDLKSITYTIRKDASWHDGTPVTAKDIVFTFKQIKDPKNNSPVSQRLRYIKNVKAIGEREVRFVFDKVYADELIHSNILIIPKHIVEKDKNNLQMSNFSFSPTGNGPYKLNEWRQGEWIELVANNDYFRGRPLLDRIVFYFPHSLEELLDEINLGNIDIAFDLPPEKYDTIKGYSTIVSSGRAYTYIGWNLKRFQDRNLRKAFSMAIDREGIISSILKGYGRLLNCPITHEHWAFNPDIKGIKHNEQKAKELLEELGYSKKSWQQYYPDLRVEILVESGNPIRKEVAFYIMSDLRSIGVNTLVTELRGSQLIDRLFNRNFDAYILGWSVDKAFNPLLIWSPNGIYNFVGYKNKKAHDLMRKALFSLDRKKAKKAWHEFQEIIAKDLPYTFLYTPQKITLVKENVAGMKHEDKRPILSYLDELYFKKVPSTTLNLASLGTHYKETQIGSEQRKAEITTPQQTLTPTEEILEAVTSTTTIEEERSTETPTEEVTTPIVEKKGPIIPPIIIYYPPKRDYPENARKLDVRGQVFIKVYISKEGIVDKADIVKGLFPSCDSAALSDAYKCRFDPATQDGEPVADSQTLPFRFPPGGW
ncbi:MAG: TonB family protein [Candidatus Stahlbacteria bacterium]|nr:MAG: TonB family protein [Candidatus Stahlbacteria bacterium]